jgi:hypothetical protein
MSLQLSAQAEKLQLDEGDFPILAGVSQDEHRDGIEV